jgi:hypothetical protein
MSAPQSWEGLAAFAGSSAGSWQISGLAKHEGFIAGQAYGLAKVTNDPDYRKFDQARHRP